jgi:hypothetical protein
MTQEKFCPPLIEQVTPLEAECGVKTYSAEQAKYNSFIQRIKNNVNLGTPAVTTAGRGTLLYYPARYYNSSLLFQNIRFNENNTRNKYMLDFYSIFRISVFGNFNDNYLKGEGTRLNKLEFPLAQAQGATDENDTFIINPIKKSFQIRGLIIQIDFTSCQLPNQTGVAQNNRLPMTTVFEDINDPINSPVRQNFRVVYEKIHTIECSDCDYEQTLCFRWQIEKQWCITNFFRNNEKNSFNLILDFIGSLQ